MPDRDRRRPSEAASTGPDREARYSVGEVARLAGVSVRTLHHYDAIGLVRPAERSAGGYRSYGPLELERLHRVLAYRELGFELGAIGALLDEPSSDRMDHLRRQRALLDARLRRLEAMRSSLDKTLEAMQMGIRLDPEELFEVFGDHDPTEHAAEAAERWGDTEAYRQSRRRAERYDKDTWRKIRDEAEAIEARLADVHGAGLAPTAGEAMEAAEAHRRHISRWFYDCSPAMHAGLAELYETDPRFRAHYDDRAEGLAAFVAAAVRANAEAREGEA